MLYHYNAPSSPTKRRTQQQQQPSIYTSYPSPTSVLPHLQQQEQQLPQLDRSRPDPSLSRLWHAHHQLEEGRETGERGGGGSVPKHRRAVSADADSSSGRGGSGSQKGGGGGEGGREGWRETGGGGGGFGLLRSRSAEDPTEIQQLPWSLAQQGPPQSGGRSSQQQQRQQEQQQSQCRPIPEEGVGPVGSATKEEGKGEGLTEPLLRSVDSQF